MERDTGNRRELNVEEAATLLGLPVVAVAALAAAGFLEPSAIDRSTGHPFFAVSDVKAFQARNADNGSGFLAFDGEAEADPKELLAALDGESEDMARRAFDQFAQVFPEARRWGEREQQRFITQARSRLEAILAVTGSGAEVDEALVGDLQDVGADAAWSGSPLLQLLVVLRISRDLVVQTAVELAEARSGRFGLTLSLLLTRILPAVDRLTDSLAQGYWAAMIGKEEDARARSQHVVEAVLLDTRPVQVLAAAEAAVMAVADDRLADVVLDVPADVEVEADARRLEQVLANLIENGLVHGAPPVRVSIGGVDASGRVVVSVSDGGPGVPEALQPTLFDGVGTLRRTARDKARGSGLGLPLVRGLTEAMGGRVWYEAVDRTSTFCVALVLTRRQGAGAPAR